MKGLNDVPVCNVIKKLNKIEEYIASKSEIYDIMNCR